MTHAEMLAALAPPRLPATMTALGLGEALALLGIGLLAGLAVFAVVAPLLARRPSRRMLIRATRATPAGERFLTIARILGHLPPALRPAAYGAAPVPTDAEIESAAIRARRPG